MSGKNTGVQERGVPTQVHSRMAWVKRLSTIKRHCNGRKIQTCKDSSCFSPHSWNFMSQEQMTLITEEQLTSTNLGRIVSQEILNFYINLDMSFFPPKYSYKGVFHHYFDILRNNSNEFYSVAKKKITSNYLHLTDLFSPL